MSVSTRRLSRLFAGGLVLYSGMAIAQPSDSEAPSVSKPPRVPAAIWPRIVVRAAALGAYRSIFDLAVLGGGAELSLGGERELHGAYFNARLVRGETKAGLTVTEATLLVSFEVRYSGVRIGAGGGPTMVRVARITNSSHLDGWGGTLFGRLGYDFAEPTGVFALFQVERQTQSVWGPTVYAGYRF